MSKPCIGIDFGTSELKIATGNGAEVKDVVRARIPDNLVKGGRIASTEAMSEFLKAVKSESKLNTRDAAVILPASLAFSRVVELPAMTLEQLELNLPYEFRDFITQEKDKYFYDYAVINIENDEQGAPKTMQLMAAATLKETIRDYADMLRRAGLKLVAAAPVEIAYANILRNFEGTRNAQEPAEYCFIDLGDTATRIFIYTGERFEVLRVIDFGGATVDEAIAEALSVDPHRAKLLKEANNEGEHGLEQCISVYQNIAVEIMRAINFYSFNNRDSKLEDIYLCGGGVYNAELIERIKEAAGDMKLHFANEILPGAGDGKDFAVGAAAIGIALN